MKGGHQIDDMSDMPVTDLQLLLQKEALYTALGCCAVLLGEKMRMSDWINRSAVPVLAIQLPEYVIFFK